MFRFFKRVVAVGQQPSRGIALTGIKSPLVGEEPSDPSRTNWGAPANAGGIVATESASGAAGSMTSWSPANAASTAA